LGVTKPEPPEGGTPNLAGFHLSIGNPPYVRSQRGASHKLLRFPKRREWTLVLSTTLLTEYQVVRHREQSALL